MILRAFKIRTILTILLVIHFILGSVEGQTCSINDLQTLKTCAQPVTDMLNSLTTKWPLPTPVPPINATWIDKFCNNYANFAICLKPKNATCSNADQIYSVVSTAGYFCQRQNFFYSKSSCLTTMIQSPSVQMRRCSLLAQDLLYHNVVDNNYQKCNSIADAMSCSYPVVQAICGRDVASAVQEFGRRTLTTMYTDCQIESCVNGTYCMYGETCRSSRSCQCTTICPDQVESVCANDGATYSNECEMRNQMCLRKIWLLKRPMVYCDIQRRFPECDDSNIDNLTHCILPLYNGMISSFQQLDSYLSNFQSFMVNRTCEIFWTYKKCARSYSKNCANPNSDVLQELYDKYVCTDQGFTDLTTNTQCWSKVGQDGQFIKCSQNFGFAIDDLKFYSKAQYVNSFTDDMGRVCTALKTLGACVMPRVQALCNQKAVAVFQKMFLTYKMFMNNCNNTCKAIFSDTSGTINSNDWKTAMSRCIFSISVPVDGNVNLAIKVIDPFDCSTDNPPFIFIYAGTFENSKNMIATYCSNKTVNGIYSTPNGVNQMTIAYERTISGGIPSPAFVATYYAGSDACVSNPCSNGSTCVNTMGGYFCQCRAGFVGINCKQYTGLCNSTTCKNNGTCIDTYALPDLSNVTAIDFTQSFDFSCQCPQSTTGRRCETLIKKERDDSSTCPSGWKLNSNNCYYLGTDLVDEPTSEGQCKSSGSSGALLASVHSDSERDLISQWMVNSNVQSVWLGTRHDGDNWRWLDQTPWDYTSWATGQPDLTLRCAVQSSSGTWNTVDCFTSAGYICKLKLPSVSCDSNPCQNGGTCTTDSTSGKSICLCKPGFTDQYCASIAACDTSPCQNGATCMSNNGVNSCTCTSGFSGLLCENSAGGCLSSPCQNGARCVDLDSSGNYQCNCVIGYTGAMCQTMVDFCQCNPCQNGGTCTPILNAYQCTCSVGFSGTTCSVLRDFCSSAPCQNGGSCFSSANSYMCSCVAGYSGTNCEQAFNPCSSTPCRNGGRCQANSNNGGFTCSCPVAYTGNLCETLLSTVVCSNNLCQNGATCQSAGNSNYTCQCPSGYSGRYCENVVDACQSNPCQNGGTCFNGPNTFICRCASGYGGPTCAASTGSLCTPSPCKNNGSCTPLTTDQYVCRCLDGWIGSLCDIDANECLRMPCGSGATCVNTQGSFYCMCADGSRGTPVCNNGSSTSCPPGYCKNGGTCSSAGSNTYKCSCKPEFAGLQCDSVLCNTGWSYYNGFCYAAFNVNMTEQMAKTYCANTGAQLASIGSTAERNFAGALMANGSLDRVWIGAEYSSSTNSWTWTDYTTWSYTAWAPNQPQRLSQTSWCVRQVLRNGVSWETNSCSTNEAVLCKIVSRDNQNGCNGNPCQNGGTCASTAGGYVCACPSGYGGVNCERASDTCQSQCQNGGTCTVKNNVAVCVCANGYTGSTCQSPCLAGWSSYMGHCYLTINSLMTFDEASSACSAKGGGSRLLTIDQQEQFYYAATLANQMSSNVWLGLKFDTSQGSFKWVTGQILGPADYQAWGHGQPKSQTMQKCVAVVGVKGFVWETSDCNKKLKAVCSFAG